MKNIKDKDKPIKSCMWSAPRKLLMANYFTLDKHCFIRLYQIPIVYNHILIILKNE